MNRNNQDEPSTTGRTEQSAEGTTSASSLTPGPQTAQVAGETQQGNDCACNSDLMAELKRGIETTRLPADLREQILAGLPPEEERERLFRELQEKGGLSFEQFMESLGLEVEPR